MASLNGTFDASGVAPAVPMEVLPAGKYLSHLIESEMLPIVRDVIGNAEPRPVFLLDAARKDGASVTLRMWLTDSGKQQNELLVALHEKYPDASIEVTEDAWLRQIVVPRL